MEFDVIVIGSGAAGMMCAAVAGQNGKRVLVLDHAKKIGEKIRISGGGRCNFTNLATSSRNFLSQNTHFAKSALARYAPQDFIGLIERHNIAWHEKAKGQLFCDGSAQQIVEMLFAEMATGGVDVRANMVVSDIQKIPDGFSVMTSDGLKTCKNLVVACGGKSIPKIGASSFGFEIARQFGLNIIETAPALVPLTFSSDDLEMFKSLAGVAVPVRVSCKGISFDEDMLFTHRGLSGPAILQISSFWHPGEVVSLNIRPDLDFGTILQQEKQSSGRKAIQTVLANYLPKRLAQSIAEKLAFQGNIADLGGDRMQELIEMLENWQVKPTGSEGYRTAEVTRGGVDTAAINAKTMEVKSMPGLYFIGEVLDVTGWLGGYNFQWAWASGQAAGQAV
ncbi:MAG: NAD(P)/FAD-dependent oxidoreductase [Rhodobacteraceae bacterium]|nr:NAD(P)/FAD-dependent oxidoreductase [Paracoccaceae bacterium]